MIWRYSCINAIYTLWFISYYNTNLPVKCYHKHLTFLLRAACSVVYRTSIIFLFFFVQRKREAGANRSMLASSLPSLPWKKGQITPVLEQGYVHTIPGSACIEKKTIPLFCSHIRMETSTRVDFESGSSPDRFLPLLLAVWTGFRIAVEVNEYVEARIGDNWDGSIYSGVTIEI